MGKIEITHEIEEKCCVHRGIKGTPAPIPQEGEWTKCKEIKDISGLTHGCGCCAPQQGTCKLTLNVKEGVIQEPNRSIYLELKDGMWQVVNEGY